MKVHNTLIEEHSPLVVALFNDAQLWLNSFGTPSAPHPGVKYQNLTLLRRACHRSPMFHDASVSYTAVCDGMQICDSKGGRVYVILLRISPDGLLQELDETFDLLESLNASVPSPSAAIGKEILFSRILVDLIVCDLLGGAEVPYDKSVSLAEYLALGGFTDDTVLRLSYQEQEWRLFYEIRLDFIKFDGLELDGGHLLFPKSTHFIVDANDGQIVYRGIIRTVKSFRGPLNTD